MDTLRKKLILCGVLVVGLAGTLSAQTAPDSLYRSIERASSDRERVEAWQAMASFFGSGQPDSARYYNERALRLSRSVGLTAETARSLLIQSEIALRRKQWDRALRSSQQAASTYRNLSDSLGLLRSWRTAGKVYRNTGRYDSSRILLLRAYRIAEALDERAEKADALTSLAMLYAQERRLGQALAYYLQSLTVYQELNDFPKVAAVQSYLGTISADRGDYERALSYLKQSLALSRRLNHTLGICTNLGKLGYCYQQMQQYDQAMSYLTESISIAEDANLPGPLVNALSAVADVYRAQGNYSQAIDYGLRVLTMVPPGSNPAMLADYHHHLGQTYYLADNYKQAKTYLQQAIDLAERAQDMDILTNSYRTLARVDSAQGWFSEALASYQRYTQTKDSLAQRQEQTRFERLQAQYQSEQKDQQIESLQQQAQIQQLQGQQQRVQIIAAVVGIALLLILLTLVYSRYRLKQRSNQQKDQLIRDKELLMQEIHHRAKNHLNTVQHLLSLQAEYLQDPQALQAVLESQSRIRAVALIHQQLYQVTPTGQVILQYYLYELLENIQDSQASNKLIVLKADIPAAITIDLSLAVPLGLIVNEVVTNAYKHAFVNQDQGRITVEGQLTEAHILQLIVTDDGRGFSDEIAPDTLGLSLVRGMVRQMNATSHFDVHSEGGTVFRLTLRSELIGRSELLSSHEDHHQKLSPSS